MIILKYIKRYWFITSMLVALVLATLTGIFAPKEFVSNISPLGELFVNLMFTLVVPLVFFTISSSIANMSGRTKLSRILFKTIVVFIITSAVSAFLMLGVLLFVDPVKDVIVVDGVAQDKSNVLLQIVSAISVSDFKDLFSKSHMLALIIFSILFGISVRVVDKEKKIARGLKVISDAMLKMVKVVMCYAPIGVYAYFANLIKSYGDEIISSYLIAFLIYIGVSAAYFLVFYPIYCYIAKGKVGIKTFFKHIWPSFTCSLATQSSLASLPTNLEVAGEMEIDKEIRQVSLPLGATIHMEGSAIGSVLKIFFLFSVFSMTPSGFMTYFWAIVIAVASGVVMSGIPGGGLIGEMLIVSLYGFPLSAFTMIATIGWIIDAPATMLNVCGDIPSAMLIEKYVNEKDD